MATGKNLFKWGKRNSSRCIYCHADIHDEKHLIYDCSSVKSMWMKTSIALTLNINYFVIITGSTASSVQNQIISLLCHLIFRKFIKDTKIAKTLNITQYIKNELSFFGSIYKNTTTASKEMIETLINVL